MDDKETYILEGMFAVILFLCTFGHSLHTQSVTMFIANMGMVQCINSGKSKGQAIMSSIKALYYYTFIYHVNYKSVHLYSVDNGSADYSSGSSKLSTPWLTQGNVLLIFNKFSFQV